MPRTYTHLVTLLVLFTVLFDALTAQQTYVISPKVRELATKDKVDQKLGSPKDSGLYIDTLTAIDLIAKERAKVLRRENGVTQEDYEAAGWMLCVLPWTPPKLPADESKIKKLRPSLVGGVFKTEDRRTKLVHRLDRRRLALNADQVKEQHLKPLDFFRPEGLEPAL